MSILHLDLYLYRKLQGLKCSGNTVAMVLQTNIKCCITSQLSKSCPKNILALWINIWATKHFKKDMLGILKRACQLINSVIPCYQQSTVQSVIIHCPIDHLFLVLVCSRKRQLQHYIPVQPEDHLTLIVTHSLMWLWLWEAKVSSVIIWKSRNLPTEGWKQGLVLSGCLTGCRKYD